MRAAAILGVVAIHATSPFLSQLAARPEGAASRFFFLAALNQAGRFSVPAFFLLSGFLTAFHAEDPPRAVGPGGYLGRRLGRLLIPYLTWSVLLCALPSLLHGEATTADLGTRFLLGWTFTGGYFLLALAQLTILDPLLLRVVRRSGRAAVLLFSASLLATEALFGAAAYADGPWLRYVREGFSSCLTLGPAWAPFFIAGLWAGGARGWLVPWMGRHRIGLVSATVALYGASLWEFLRVHDRTASLGLAASFLKPTSVLFAFAACGVCLGAREAGLATRPFPAADAAPLAPVWRALAGGSYAIYLLHGGVVLALCGIASPWWQGLLETPAGPLVLGVCGIALPLAFFRLAERRAPAWARFAMFG